MALIDFQQTDTAAVCTPALFCSAAGSDSFENPKQATQGGSAGVTAVTNNIVGSGTNQWELFFECILPAGATGDAGDWTVRFNVTTANMNITWNATSICKIDSSCGTHTSVGSTTHSVSLGTTGVKSATITGSAVTVSAGDKVAVIHRFTNSAMTDQSFGWTPDQIINSAFDDGGGPATVLKDIICYGMTVPFPR